MTLQGSSAYVILYIINIIFMVHNIKSDIMNNDCLKH